MNERTPIKLRKEPLLEAIWEVRFSQGGHVPIGQLLPGVLYKALREQFPTVIRLPAADLPPPVAQMDPALVYTPSFRLESHNLPFAIQTGNRVVSFNNRRPYAGWRVFSKHIKELLDLLESLKLIQTLERFSLRYLDLIELDPPPSLDSLEIHLTIGRHDLKKEHQPVQLRTEIKEEPFIQILQIATPVDVAPGGGDQRRGTLVAIDTVYPRELSWDEVRNHLDHAHARSKQLFFGLLTADATKRLDPVYDQ